MTIITARQVDKRYIDVLSTDPYTENIDYLGYVTTAAESTGPNLENIESVGNTVGDIKQIGMLIPELESMLPFRINFKNISYFGYSPNNPPPIGIAIIGDNNYIL